jgi:hypothetical protein
MCPEAQRRRVATGGLAAGAAWIVLLLAAGCAGDRVPEPYKDFQVIAESESGGTLVYLCEARRVGRSLHLLFRYREPQAQFHKTSASCPHIPGSLGASFDPVMVKDGWTELRCRLDYPEDAEKLGFTLRMCEERSRENSDAVLEVNVPSAGEIVKPGLSGSVNGVTFSIETIANLEGKFEMGADRKSAKAAIPYGAKEIIIKNGKESVLVVVYKAFFAGSIPDLPREYTEWDQVLVSTDKGVKLGGWPYTSDTGGARYFALVSVDSDPMPRVITAWFYSAKKLSSFRREFAFSGLANPRE